MQQTIDESFGDVLKSSVLAALLAIPGLVSADEIESKIDRTGNSTVQISAPETQKKIYNILGKDRVNKAIIINIVARTLMAEGVGETNEDALLAISSVIWNRANGNANNFISVVLAPSQFSCWNKFNDYDKMNFVIRPHGQAAASPERWNLCVRIATAMVNGKYRPSFKFTHYYNPNTSNPSWKTKLINKKTIGNHIFGNIPGEFGTPSLKKTNRKTGKNTKSSRVIRANGTKIR